MSDVPPIDPNPQQRSPRWAAAAQVRRRLGAERASEDDDRQADVAFSPQGLSFPRVAPKADARSRRQMQRFVDALAAGERMRLVLKVTDKDRVKAVCEPSRREEPQ